MQGRYVQTLLYPLPSCMELTFSIKDWDILVGEVVFTTGLCRRMLLFYAEKPSPSPLPTVQSSCLSYPVGLPVGAAPLEIRTRYQTCAPLELERQAFLSNSSVNEWRCSTPRLISCAAVQYYRSCHGNILPYNKSTKPTDQKKCDPKTGRCVGSVCPCVFVSEDDRAFHYSVGKLLYLY